MLYHLINRVRIPNVQVRSLCRLNLDFCRLIKSNIYAITNKAPIFNGLTFWGRQGRR